MANPTYFSRQLTSFYISLLNVKILNLAILPMPVYIRILYLSDESFNWSVWTDKNLNIAFNTVDKNNAKKPLINDKTDPDIEIISN